VSCESKKITIGLGLIVWREQQQGHLFLPEPIRLL